MEVSSSFYSYRLTDSEIFPDEFLPRRLWFISKLQPVTEGEFKHALILSNYFYYREKYHCEYSEYINRKISSVTETMNRLPPT